MQEAFLSHQLQERNSYIFINRSQCGGTVLKKWKANGKETESINSSLIGAD